MVNGKAKYNVVSLFSGAMGLDLGLEQAGLHTAVCVEMDKLACQTIRENTSIPVIEGDISKVSTDEILIAAKLKRKDVFMVVGGPPCQAFSTAGKRLSLQDFRGNVIVNYLRVVEEIAPPYFILENVRGMLSTPLNAVPSEYENEYGSMTTIPGSIVYFLWNEFSKMGYELSFTLFNSANYGVPQIRERVIIFGSKKGRIPLPSPTHSETGFETGKKWVTIAEAFKGLGKQDQYFELTERMKRFVGMLKEGENWTDLPKELQKEAMGKSFELNGGKTGFYRRLAFNRPSPTLLTSPVMNATLLAHPTELRSLSVQEYARIQQFPDTWKLKGKLTDIFKQIGNAVPTGLGYAAGRAILDFHQGDFDPQRERKNRIPYSRYLGCSDFEFIPTFKGLLQKNKQQELNFSS
jgi:DNA (cytosine-5)-methyltransferase 1